MANIRSNQQGFTLLELLIAISIFAIGLLSIATMQITSIRTNSAANTMTAGSALAGGILEEILAWQASDPRLAANSTNNNWDFDPGPSVLLTKTIVGGGQYTALYSVAVNYNGESKLSRIAVVVNGNGRSATLVGFRRI